MPALLGTTLPMLCGLPTNPAVRGTGEDEERWMDEAVSDHFTVHCSLFRVTFGGVSRLNVEGSRFAVHG
eukprot:2793052-Rhodomonas_salina.3